MAMFKAWIMFIVVVGFAVAIAGNLKLAPSADTAPAPARQVLPSSSSVSDSRQQANSMALDEGSVELQRADDGHFYADVRINGASVHMLVDTGSSGIALSREDASAAGLASSIGMPNVVGHGADGDVHGEWVKLNDVELGPLTAHDLDAVILNGGEQSLLGQTFLSKFSSVEIRGNEMVLH
jgi:aspartyl protease family protein